MDKDFVDRIYEAAILPEMWPDILDELAVMIGAKGGMLISAFDRNLNWTATDSVAEDFDTYVKDGYFRRCGRRICLFEQAHSEFKTELDYWTEEEYAGNEIYNEFFRPRDLGVSAGTSLSIPTGDHIVFSIEKSHRDGPIEADAKALLNEFRPHLARSALMAARLGLKNANAAGETLESLGVPTLLLNVDGRIVETRNLSDDVANQMGPPQTDRITFHDANAQDLLTAALDAMSRGVVTAAQSFPIRDAGDTPVMVGHIIPIHRSAHDIFAQGYALLVLIPVTSKAVPSADLVRSLFDLTASEARVARALASGQSPEDIASDGDVSMNTVRTQIRKVLEKTGCSRQAEVVSMLNSLSLQRS